MEQRCELDNIMDSASELLANNILMDNLLKDTAKDPKKLSDLMNTVSSSPELMTVTNKLKDEHSLSTLGISKKDQKKYARLANGNKSPTPQRVLLIKHSRTITMADVPSVNRVADMEKVHIKDDIFAIHDPRMPINSLARKRLGLQLRGDVYVIRDVDGDLMPFTEDDLNRL